MVYVYVFKVCGKYCNIYLKKFIFYFANDTTVSLLHEFSFDYRFFVDAVNPIFYYYYRKKKNH